MEDPETKARATLRGDILAMGHDDFVSMADVQGQIDRGRLADLPAERQQLVVETVRSLLADGLIEVGVIPSPSSPGFQTWPGTVDEVMTRFTDRFVEHYDERDEWVYKIWFNLTARGEKAAADVLGKESMAIVKLERNQQEGARDHYGTTEMTENETAAEETLRDEILAGGHDDWVSMAEVRGSISRGRLADSASDRQQLMLRIIRSLLLDGLVEIGDIPGPTDPGFLVWPGTLEEVMAGLTERIVDQSDDPDSWEYSTWLNLTPKGHQASDELVRIHR